MTRDIVEWREKYLNKIVCGDCLELMKELPDGCVDAVVTDPPYGIAYKTGRRKQKWHEFCSEIANDRDLWWFEPCIEELMRIMKDNTAIYWFTNHDAIDIIKPMFSDRFVYKNTITWVKNNWTAGDLVAQYGKQTELILYGNKGRCPLNGRRDTDVWYYYRVAGDSQYHQNEKPTDMIEYAIVKSSLPNAIILDPFLGSGTTAVAALRTGRQFIGMEISPEYCAIAQRRVDAELAQTKLDFEGR